MEPITVRKILEVARDFDRHGGTSLGLLTWELSVELPDLEPAWREAIKTELLMPAIPPAERAAAAIAGAEQERFWRLTPAGWAVLGVDPEADRIRADTVAQLGLLVGDPPPEFQALARVCVALLGTWGSAINIFDERYEHRIASVGVPVEANPAHNSFCRLVIDAGTPIQTSDAPADPRFAYSSHSRDENGVRFYAAAPLRSPDRSTVIGTFCVFDPEPRTFTAEEQAHLADFARLAEAQIELARLKFGQQPSRK